jgi:hypothetical protein
MVRLRVGKVWADAGMAPATSVATATMHVALFIGPFLSRMAAAKSNLVKRSANARSMEPRIPCRREFSSVFFRWAQTRVILALIRAAISERYGKFPARLGREFVLPAQGIFHGRARNY